MATELQERAVWPLALRLIHWLFVVCFTILFVTGWLVGSEQLLNEELRLWLIESLHVPSGQLTTAALVARIVLLFMPGVTGWRALLPVAVERTNRREMLFFYLSWGRREVPGYFAHDPLWKVGYLILFIMLAVQVFSGLSLYMDGLRYRVGASAASLQSLHETGSVVLLWLVGLHIASVLLREVRGKGYEISAMLHGNRIYRIEKGDDALATVNTTKVAIPKVSLPIRKRPSD